MNSRWWIFYGEEWEEEKWWMCISDEWWKWTKWKEIILKMKRSQWTNDWSGYQYSGCINGQCQCEGRPMTMKTMKPMMVIIVIWRRPMKANRNQADES